MKNWQHYWKSILAFLVLVATNAAADLMRSSQPWPTNGGEWTRWGVSIVGGTLLVFGKGNAPKNDAASRLERNPEVKARVAAAEADIGNAAELDLPPANGPTSNPARRPVI